MSRLRVSHIGLKRGYDFVIADRNFNDDDAVVHLFRAVRVVDLLEVLVAVPDAADERRVPPMYQRLLTSSDVPVLPIWSRSLR